MTAIATTALALLPVTGRGDPLDLSAPLGVTTPGPIRQLFLDATIADARTVTRRGLRLRLESANSWSVPAVLTRGTDAAEVQTDAQADALVISATLPWSRADAEGWPGRFATTLGWRLTGFWGGFTDDVIEGWHGLIGSTNFLRERYPRNQIHVRLTNGNGTGAFDVNTSRLAVGDLVVGTQARLASGGQSHARGATPADDAWAIAARLDVKLPLGSPGRLGGSGGMDAALSVLATVELAPWIVLHGRTTASLVSPISAASVLQPNTLQLAAEASIVLMAGRWALVLEDRYLSALMDGTGWVVADGRNSDFFLASPYASLFRAHNQITVGIRRDVLTLSVSEDFTPGSNPRGAVSWFYDSNAPDVVVAFTVRLPL